MSTVRLDSKPGTHWVYSNLAVALLGEALAAESHKDFEHLLKDTICDPLGLNDTGSTLSKDQESRLAQAYYQGQPAPRIYPSPAAGGLYSSTTDLCAFLRAYMGTQTGSLGSAMKLSYQPIANSPNGKMGMCWQIDPSSHIVWKNGSVPGFKSFIGFIPGSGKGIVVLAGCSRFKPGIIGKGILLQQFENVRNVEEAEPSN
jgi:CubicO group peptidase (beta-lactamase class C family)